MPAATLIVRATAEEVFALARLTDEDLLLRAKADLLTRLAVDVLAARGVPEVLGGLSKLIETIRVFRERTARSAGLKLAPVVSGMFDDGGDAFCKKINYCERRNVLRDSLDRVRKALKIAEVTNDLAEIGELLASIVEALSSLKLPLSVIFLILLYSMDEVCKCSNKTITEKNKKKPRKQ